MWFWYCLMSLCFFPASVQLTRCDLSPRACRDLQNIAFEWGPINKQLQERRKYLGEWLHDGEAFNFWFHSPLAEGKGGQANSSRFPMDTHKAPPSPSDSHTHRQKHVLFSCLAVFERPVITSYGQMSRLPLSISIWIWYVVERGMHPSLPGFLHAPHNWTAYWRVQFAAVHNH